MSHIDVKRLRLRSGIGQRELARRMGVTAKMGQKWDKGSQPLADKLPQLAELFGCTIEELYSSAPSAE